MPVAVGYVVGEEGKKLGQRVPSLHRSLRARILRQKPHVVWARRTEPTLADGRAACVAGRVREKRALASEALDVDIPPPFVLGLEQSTERVGRVIGLKDAARGGFSQQRDDRVPPHGHERLLLERGVRPPCRPILAEPALGHQDMQVAVEVQVATERMGNHDDQEHHRATKNYQLDVFDPNDGHYEYSAVTSNLSLTVRNLWYFACGRGNHEKTIAQLKTGLAFHSVPTQTYAANSAWQQLVVLAHNLLTNFQLETGAPQRRRTRKHTVVPLLQSVQTLRFELFHRAALLVRPGGKMRLRMTDNLPTRQSWNTSDRLQRERDRLRRERDRLRRENERLQQALDLARRAAKRPAAPFSKGPPSRHPRRPGRRAGRDDGRHGQRARPAPIDDVIPVGLPAACPHCAGAVAMTRVAAQYQEELPDVRPLVRRRIRRSLALPTLFRADEFLTH